MTAPTPGPWSLEIRVNPEDLAQLRATNAELLAALKLAVARCEKCGGFKPEFWCDECVVARAAIKRAEGK